MAAHSLQPWIPVDRIAALVLPEPAFLLVGLSLGAWLVYKLFLRGISPERHRRLRRHFLNLLLHLVLGGASFVAYLGLDRMPEHGLAVERLTAYVGLMAIVFGATVFVKVSRILLFEYLFLGHMREGVPVLLVNLFTLVLSIVVAGWMANEVFSIRLAPLLATSAILSIVLGLALQDTLGNLFAGVAIQFDKPYTIGDWVEVNNGGQRWVGRVHEVSWRATLLTGTAEEEITIPNRVVGQAQISNFSSGARPIIRSQVFKLPFRAPVDETKRMLASSALSVGRVRKNPAPLVLITEATESWLTFKLIYFIDDYGSQASIGDEVIRASLRALHEGGIELASQRLELVKLF